MRRQHTEWEEVCAGHSTDKGLFLKTKTCEKLIVKEINILVTMSAKKLALKKIYRWP